MHNGIKGGKQRHVSLHYLVLHWPLYNLVTLHTGNMHQPVEQACQCSWVQVFVPDVWPPSLTYKALQNHTVYPYEAYTYVQKDSE